MTFQAFAIEHGVIIKDVQMGKWVRVPTVDHPHSRNGAYIFNGETGAVQNWAVHSKPIHWSSGAPIDRAKYTAQIKKAEKETQSKRQAAARKAAWIMKSVTKSTHPYLAKKGFPQEVGWVWNDLLIIPMRLNESLVGCQTITADGTKKFLYGQQTKGVSCVFDNKGVDIACEGYATALSIRRALKAARTRYRIWVCFSAGNLVEVSKGLQSGLVVADHDPAGITAANKTGLTTWLSDVEGEDFNDYEMRVGTEKAGDSLLKRLQL